MSSFLRFLHLLPLPWMLPCHFSIILPYIVLPRNQFYATESHFTFWDSNILWSYNWAGNLIVLWIYFYQYERSIAAYFLYWQKMQWWRRMCLDVNVSGLFKNVKKNRKISLFFLSSSFLLSPSSSLLYASTYLIYLKRKWKML